MFVFLSKKLKISLSGSVDLNAIGWNREHGWLAIGGDEGKSRCGVVKALMMS